MTLLSTIKKICSKGKEHISNTFRKDVVYTTKKSTGKYKKNIIFLLPALRYPCGGNIVVHNNSEVINSLNYKNFQSQVLYPLEPNFSPTLFNHAANLKKDLKLDSSKDFVIIPEIYAAEHAKALTDIGVSYAINVLNGYLMNFEMTFRDKSFEQLKYAYENASLIIGVSDDSIANIKMVFPNCTDKIIKSSYVIDKASFRPINSKKNLITYMPRKLPKHSQLFMFMLNNKLPKHWSIEPIDGVSENEVYNIFSNSKLFLSFSEFEGLAMPPVMAALSGNLVIGYTGEGNKDYFNMKCFQEVPSGDIREFIEKVLMAVDSFDKNNYNVDLDVIDQLSKMFSKEMQINYIKQLIDAVDEKLR